MANKAHSPRRFSLDIFMVQIRGIGKINNAVVKITLMIAADRNAGMTSIHLEPGTTVQTALMGTASKMSLKKTPSVQTVNSPVRVQKQILHAFEVIVKTRRYSKSIDNLVVKQTGPYRH